MVEGYLLKSAANSRALLLAGSLLLSLLVSHKVPILAQAAPERFWLAGRYDGNRIIVYFDAVKFGNTFPRDAVKIAYPIADSFFNPVGLSPAYVAGFQQKPGAEHFSIGDRYDLLLGDGGVTTVKLTTLVGFQSDEVVGNDSFIGALATPEDPDWLLFSRNYYVVRRHVDLPPNSPKPRFDPDAPRVRLDPDPVRFDVQTSVAALVVARMKTAFTSEDLKKAEKISPILHVQRFMLSDGSNRYFVWADWRAEKGPNYTSILRLGAWISPSPTIHLLAAEPPSTADGIQNESVLNVVDLGNGRTGIIVNIQGSDSRATQLMEYKDGAALKGMRVIQTVGAGE